MPDFTGSRIDHFNLAVPDLARSLAFYRPTLESIGITELLAIPADESEPRPAMHGFGVFPKPFFWLIDEGIVGSNMHLAFTVESRAAVDTFFDTALAAGASVHMAPGVRPEYHENYYGGFVFDPDGVNLEAVCHTPEN